MKRYMSCRRLVRGIALTITLILPLGLGGPAVLAQDAVAVLHDVRFVDTSGGQDVEFSTTGRPGDVVPLQRDACTFAVELPNVVPAAELTSQFFRSELVQNLTLRTASGRAATEICVETAVPVRSRVATRDTGMTMRLIAIDRPPPPEARPVDATDADALPAPAGPATPAAAPDASSVQRERELTLALREERVARRELQLEVTDLRRRLTEQIEANARLDQAATREEAQSDLLEPRIDRLVSLLGVSSSGLPVERFDAALATLRSSIERQSEGADAGREIEQELGRLLAVIEGTDDSLVMTNDAVNVRLGPSTEETRVAFLPAGVLLRVEERRGPWSRVTSGTFEGWIFDELLEPADLQPLSDRAPAGQGRIERLRHAARTVARLDQERQLVLLAVEERDREEEQAQRAALAPLEDRLARTESELALARAEIERLVQELDRKESDLSIVAQQAADAASGRLEERIQGLAVWLPEASPERVRVTAATNLRVGPGTEEERVALLPPGFELVVLDRREDWVQVVYGALTGWMAVAYTEPVGQGGGGDGAKRLSADLVLDRIEFLLGDGERLRSESDPGRPSDGTAARDALPAEESTVANAPSNVLRGAADAIYQQFAAARRRDAEGFLSFYAEDFAPAEGSLEAWREHITDQVERGLYAGSQVQNLSLRRISDDLVEASFLVDGADPEVVRRRRVDLARVDGSWRVLVETTADATESGD